MAFADWKKRSDRFANLVQRALYGRVGAKDLHEVCQAAYKAGERQGRKDAEAIAMNAIELRDAALDAPQPLLWMCKCGWVGTVAKMDKDYCCPACGGFSTLSVVMFRQARVLGNVCV